MNPVVGLRAIRYPPRHVNARFARVILSRFFATGCSVVTGLILLKLLPRYLTTESFGVVGVVLVVLGYLPLLDGGFRLVLNRELLASTGGPRAELLQFGQVLATRLTLVALVIGPLLTIAYSLSADAHAAGLPFLFYVAVGMAGAVTFASTMQVLTLVGLDRQGLMSFIQGGGSMLNLAVLWIGLHGHLGVWAFPLGQATAAVGMWSAATWCLRQLSPATPVFRWDWAQTCQLLWITHRRSAWAVCRMQLLIVLLLSLDLVLAGWITHDGQGLASWLIVARVLGIGRGFLTSLGEASWPRIARGDTDPAELTRRVLALNAWIYGAVTGVLLGALPAVLDWYVTTRWSPAPLLLTLLVLRFHAIGLTSPASYHLIGSGDYRTMVRCVGTELALGTVGGLIAGWWFGAAGVAAAFLAATGAGTFFPIFAAYARRHHLATGPIFCGIWIRSLVAGGLSFGCAHALVIHGWQGPASLAAAGAGGGAGLLLAAAFAWWQGRTQLHLPPLARLWSGL